MNTAYACTVVGMRAVYSSRFPTVKKVHTHIARMQIGSLAFARIHGMA